LYIWERSEHLSLAANCAHYIFVGDFGLGIVCPGVLQKLRNAEQQLLALTVGPRPEHDPQTLLEAVRYFADPDVTHLSVKVANLRDVWS
jgi:hypothetical protein